MAHRSPWPGLRAFLVLILTATALPIGIAAQGTTSSTSNQGITLAASGLENPRGFDWGSDDTLYVALAGSGGERAGKLPDAAASAYTGGLTASVVWIDNGCGAAYQDNLPSTRDDAGTIQGASSVTVLDGRPYVLIDGGGAVYGNPSTPSGIYRIDGDGSARLIADIGAWIASNPSLQSQSDRDPAGGLTAMTDDEESFWVVEQSYGQLLRVTPDGAIERIADLSAEDEAPSAIAIAPDGGVYVGFQTNPPFVDGAAHVVHIDQGGEVTDVWSGLTAISGLAVDSNGTLYALELGRNGSGDEPFVATGTGKVVRQNGPDAAIDVAIGLDYPDAMNFGPDGGLYVTIPGTGATGGVIRINTQQGQTMTMSDSLFAGSKCVVSTPMPLSPASPVANASTPIPAGDGGTPVPANSGSAVSVEIVNFAYSPASTTVAVGTTVTWTNNDVMPHTVTAKDGTFDSGNLAPGESFSFTFAQAGTFAYGCQYHPNMAGTVVVE